MEGEARQECEPRWMSAREEVWQASLHERKADLRGTECCEPSARQLSCSDGYKLQRRMQKYYTVLFCSSDPTVMKEKEIEK